MGKTSEEDCEPSGCHSTSRRQTWIVQVLFIGNLILKIRHLTSIVSGSTTLSESTIQLTTAQPLNKSPTFVTLECSLPCSQESAPTPPQKQSHKLHHVLFLNTHFSIILIFPPATSKKSVSFRCSYQKPVCISFVSDVCHMSRQSHLL